jgi:hypothetical protein
MTPVRIDGNDCTVRPAAVTAWRKTTPRRATPSMAGLVGRSYPRQPR